MTRLLDNIEMVQVTYIIVYGERYLCKDIYMDEHMGIYRLWRLDIDKWDDYDYVVTLDNRVIATTSLELLDFVDYYENLENY